MEGTNGIYRARIDTGAERAGNGEITLEGGRYPVDSPDYFQSKIFGEERVEPFELRDTGLFQDGERVVLTFLPGLFG